MADQFILPDLGEGIHEAQIVQVLVKEGEVVEEDQPLMEVETDKAAVEIPSPQAGTIAKIHVTAGQTVNVGDVMVTYGNDLASAKPEPQAAPATPPAVAAPAAARPVRSQPPARSGPAPSASTAPSKTGRPAKVAASPAVRRQAKELGIDLATISGSGPGGRVTQADFDNAASGGTPTAKPPTAPAPTATPSPAPGPAAARSPASELPDFTKWGPIRREPLTQIRKTIAKQMVRSESICVHVTHHDLADVEMLEQLRKDHNARLREGDPKLTLLPFVVKAICAAMKQYPIFNASFDHDRNEIIYKDYFHYGIAVDTPRGLVVPVIRDVDRKSIRDLAIEMIDMGEKARQASFTIDELRGGTFTITNIGALGGIVSTPIINYPEVAILGLGKAEHKAVVVGGKVVARYTLPLNLAFDHRVTDGADAARFVGEIKGYLEVPGRLLLED